MYFKSRSQAGKLLADQIVPDFRHKKCAVVALNDGGIVVGAEIAKELGCVLTLLLTETIDIPRENMALAGITSDGAFTYNNLYSPGEIEEFVSEYYHFIEQEKMSKMQLMHRLFGKKGLIRHDLLKGRNIILVSDGLSSGFALDIARVFLKPISYDKLIIATPLASVPAVDRMHVIGDRIYCLSVIEEYITTDHYYDVKDVPSHETLIGLIEQIIEKWRST